ncbi:MAG: ATP-binding protein [Verrucomicrobiota bacterium]
MSFDRRIQLLTLLAGLPAIAIALGLIWLGDFTAKAQWTLTVFMVLFWLGASWVVRERVAHPLQTISNLLSGLREGDFSTRARGARHYDPLGELLVEVNTLGQTLQEQRLGALEATALLRTVIAEIDVAIFTFDQHRQLRLINRAGERLLGQPCERLLGRTADEIGLGECLQAELPSTIQSQFPGRSGRWVVRRSSFREQGVPHQLLVLSDLSRELREEERQAWQRLVRVLGHELNNSLAPIKSIAGSLENLLRQDAASPEWKEDMHRGLSVIAARAESLNRFMQAYALLARLPPPKLQPVQLAPMIERVAGLETRVPFQVKAGPPMVVKADSDQLEQLLINLVRNAADAALETQGAVMVSWSKAGAQAEVVIEDEGPGLSNTANLFVPFFTTKPKGTGIGLVLSRQIAEAHGGSVTLMNRKDGRGCLARLRLPAS